MGRNQTEICEEIGTEKSIVSRDQATLTVCKATDQKRIHQDWFANTFLRNEISLPPPQYIYKL